MEEPVWSLPERHVSLKAHGPPEGASMEPFLMEEPVWSLSERHVLLKAHGPPCQPQGLTWSTSFKPLSMRVG